MKLRKLTRQGFKDYVNNLPPGVVFGYTAETCPLAMYLASQYPKEIFSVGIASITRWNGSRVYLMPTWAYDFVLAYDSRVTGSPPRTRLVKRILSQL